MDEKHSHNDIKLEPLDLDDSYLNNQISSNIINPPSKNKGYVFRNGSQSKMEDTQSGTEIKFPKDYGFDKSSILQSYFINNILNKTRTKLIKSVCWILLFMTYVIEKIASSIFSLITILVLFKTISDFKSELSYRNDEIINRDQQITILQIF